MAHGNSRSSGTTTSGPYGVREAPRPVAGCGPDQSPGPPMSPALGPRPMGPCPNARPARRPPWRRRSPPPRTSCRPRGAPGWRRPRTARSRRSRRTRCRWRQGRDGRRSGRARHGARTPAAAPRRSRRPSGDRRAVRGRRPRRGRSARRRPPREARPSRARHRSRGAAGARRPRDLTTEERGAAEHEEVHRPSQPPVPHRGNPCSPRAEEGAGLGSGRESGTSSHSIETFCGFAALTVTGRATPGCGQRLRCTRPSNSTAVGATPSPWTISCMRHME